MFEITHVSSISDSASEITKIRKRKMRFLTWVFLVDFFFDELSVFGSPPIGDPAPSDPVRLDDLAVTII